MSQKGGLFCFNQFNALPCSISITSIRCVRGRNNRNVFARNISSNRCVWTQ